MTEDLLSGMVKTICGSYKITYHPQGPDGPPIEIDFTPPFKRYSMMSTLEEKLGVKLPDPTTLETEEARKYVLYLASLLATRCYCVLMMRSWWYRGTHT